VRDIEKLKRLLLKEKRSHLLVLELNHLIKAVFLSFFFTLVLNGIKSYQKDNTIFNHFLNE
jgi:hypothetical protein